MVARKKTRKGGPRKTSAHVRGPSDIKDFIELLKNMKILVVIITADWCGHCQKRKGEFQELMSMSKAPGVGVAQVDETQVKNIPILSNAKIKGYPSAVLLQNPNSNSTNTVLATFDGPDGPTNALPKSDTNSLKEIISNGSANATAGTNASNIGNLNNLNNFKGFEEENDEVEPESNTINLKNLPTPPRVESISIEPTKTTGGSRSMGLFKKIEEMVGKTINLTKKVTRKARNMGNKMTRRVRKMVRRFR